MSHETFLMRMILFHAVLWLFFAAFHCWQYACRRRSAGRVLTRVAFSGQGGGRFLLGTACYAGLVLFMLHAVRQMRADMMYNQIFWTAILFVYLIFAGLPAAVCENGVLFPFSGYMDWKNVVSYGRKNNRTVVFYLNEYFGFRKQAVLRHPAAQEQELDALLKNALDRVEPRDRTEAGPDGG